MKALTLFFLAAVATSATRAQHRDLLRVTTGAGGTEKVRTAGDWQRKRTQILRQMQEAMGPLPDYRELPAPEAEISDSLVTDAYTRLTLTLHVAPGESVPAYLYIPSGGAKPAAAMLVLHPTGAPGKDLVDGAGPKPNRAHARELATRGYVVLAPDFPGYGALKAYDFDNDRYASGSIKGVFNHIRCVDFLAGRKEVDPERIGVIGHSLGGYNAIFAGAFDERLKVVVSSSGWTLFDYYQPDARFAAAHGGRLGPWAQPVHMPLLRDKYHLDGSRFPFDFDEAIAAIAPRAFFSNSPMEDYFTAKGVKKGIDRVRRVYDFFSVPEKLEVRYPAGGHDFPAHTRREAYAFIDSILKHHPEPHSFE